MFSASSAPRSLLPSWLGGASWQQPGVAPTSRWMPVAGLLAACVAVVFAVAAPAGVRLDDRAAAASLLLFAIAPLGLASLSWLRDRSFRARDLLIAGVAGLLAIAGGPFAVVSSALCVAASLALLRSRSLSFPWFHWLQRRTPGAGLLRALITAAVVTIVLLLLSSRERTPAPGADEILLALSSGVSQEAGWRLFGYVAAIYLMGGVPRTRMQRAWCLALMIVPQVLLYTLARVVAGSWSGLALEGAIVAVVYVAPMALLLRRFGVVPAVVCHLLVDAVRFAALA